MKAAVEKWSENMCRACGIGKGQRESNALARGFPAAMYAMWVRLRVFGRGRPSEVRTSNNG